MCPRGTSESSSAQSENCSWSRPDEEGEQGQEGEEKRDGNVFERDEGILRREDACPEREEPGTHRREDAGRELKEEEEPNRAEHEDGEGWLPEAAWGAKGGRVSTRQPWCMGSPHGFMSLRVYDPHLSLTSPFPVLLPHIPET
ncbi:hypothetical protein NDU88_003894 [Pleurodeles waltl]|uniref:Uncharacterized protein n=1 Tax=Pleurodeles waltl TaxID=8319 RepID=A0AAV7LGR9_PLEWA|nr:hypothetical protein NDU88_003894 [Pleurodeles waltl]